MASHKIVISALHLELSTTVILTSYSNCSSFGATKRDVFLVSRNQNRSRIRNQPIYDSTNYTCVTVAQVDYSPLDVIIMNLTKASNFIQKNVSLVTYEYKLLDGVFKRVTILLYVTTMLVTYPSSTRCLQDNLGLLTDTLMTYEQVSCADGLVTVRCPLSTNVIIKIARYTTTKPNITKVVGANQRELRDPCLKQPKTYSNNGATGPSLSSSASATVHQLTTSTETSSLATDVFGKDEDDDFNNDKKCRWLNSLEYSLLQTAVEACRSKQHCQFQAAFYQKFDITNDDSDTNAEKIGNDVTHGASLSKRIDLSCLNDTTYVHIAYNCRPSYFISKVSCEDEKMLLECESYTRLAIFSASYGRTQYQSVQCPQPQGVAEETCLLSYATEIVIERCHGKRNCSIVANASTFANPCKDRSRVYLKVVYACVPRAVLMSKYQEASSVYPDEHPITEYQRQSYDGDRFFGDDDYDVVAQNSQSLAPARATVINKNHRHFHASEDDVNAEYAHNDNDDGIVEVRVSSHRSDYGNTNDTDAQRSDHDKTLYYVYLIGGASGVLFVWIMLVTIRFGYRKWRRSRNTYDCEETENDEANKYDKETAVDDKSISEEATNLDAVDSDATFVDMAPVSHDDARAVRTLIPTSHQVVRYGKDGLTTPRSLCTEDNSRFYYD